jgi:16S rRNA G966 N2-methylase RsmD
MARNRARLQQSASLNGGLALGTTIHPYDGSDPQTTASASGTSIFDPVLCELMCRWFSPPGGLVLDPFAGGSVRGIVASKLGRRYLGVDLREEQCEANRRQARVICGEEKHQPEWISGDSLHLKALTKNARADFVFSCPPYADLEVYSDDPRDISTMEYPRFREVLGQIIANACAQLRDDRFACFVVGDARDADGFYYGIPEHTCVAFKAAGLKLYNEAILVTAAGSLPFRVRKQFETSRKLGKTHQNVLIFAKGDPRKAADNIGPVEMGTGEPEHPAILMMQGGAV